MFAWKASRSVSRRQPGGVCKLQHSKPWWLGKFDASQPFFIHSILHPGVHPSIPDDTCFCRSCHGFSCLHPFHVSAWFCSCALLPFRCPFFSVVIIIIIESRQRIIPTTIVTTTILYACLFIFSSHSSIIHPPTPLYPFVHPFIQSTCFMLQSINHNNQLLLLIFQVVLFWI